MSSTNKSHFLLIICGQELEEKEDQRFCEGNFQLSQLLNSIGFLQSFVSWALQSTQSNNVDE